jgi:probable F420-dependent oxidoreductase
MKFSITYPMIAHPYNPVFLEKRNVVRFAQAAEKAGVDAIGFTDHPAPSDKWLRGGGHDALDPFVALAFCAAVTERIRLMPNIVVLPYRNPFVLAKAIATLDVLSEGRFILATAAGYLRAEYQALGVDFEERNELFDESIEAMKGIWSQERFSFEGRHFIGKELTANPRPLQKPHPPIWIGGNSKRARRRVARYAQGWMPFHAPALMARTTKTPVLETREDLRGFLGELWKMCEAEKRDPKSIDIHFHNNDGGQPGDRNFDAGRHLEGLRELAELGVTWTGTGAPGDGIEHALDAMARYGEDVIAKARR